MAATPSNHAPRESKSWRSGHVPFETCLGIVSVDRGVESTGQNTDRVVREMTHDRTLTEKNMMSPWAVEGGCAVPDLQVVLIYDAVVHAIYALWRTLMSDCLLGVVASSAFAMPRGYSIRSLVHLRDPSPHYRSQECMMNAAVLRLDHKSGIWLVNVHMFTA